VIVNEDLGEKVQSRLAESLFKGHGERLISLGAHPLPGHLYNPQPDSPNPYPTHGTALTSSQLNSALARLRTACKALKAELNEMYCIVDEAKDSCYGCWLVRLTPRGVEEIMEVRVAVVGNVDAGKSTTLGVLTRGGLDDGRGKVSRHPALMQD
jgi:hypothetical protein